MIEPRLRFPSGARLSGARQFAAVFAARTRQDLGWIIIHGALNGTLQTRLGLSIGARAGNAIRRSRIKRLVREAFRLERMTLPKGLDLVVSVRDSGDRPLADYRAVIAVQAGVVALKLAERDRRQNPPKGGSAEDA